MHQHKTLILSREDDEHVVRLTAELEKLARSWIRFDPGDFPNKVEVRAQLSNASCATHLLLPDGQQVALEEINSIWYRRPTPLQTDEALPAIQRLFIEREARAGLWGVLRALDGVWINHPGAIREAAYKPHQLAI